MLTRIRRLRTVSAITGACLVAGALASVAGSGASARAGHPPGIVGSATTLATGQSFEIQGHPFDVATRPDGTAYIGWISSTAADTDRKVHLCTLPVNSTTCTGGIQTIASLGISSANGLRVLVDSSDTVHLIWSHETANSINGPNNDAIAQATAPHGQSLSAASDFITNAPSFGRLMYAVMDGSGTIWTVAYGSGLPSNIQVWHGSTGPETVSTPWGIGAAQLAFTGGNAVMSIEKYGSISTAPSYATRSSGTWGGFHALAKSWAVSGNAALVTTHHGLRLVSSKNDASYRPVIASWNGTAFGTPSLTTDKNSCGVNTHDGWADASGRLLDASFECDDVTITNYPDAKHSGIVRFAAGGTPGHQPEAASGTRGIATVIWAISKTDGEVLKVAHVRLADSTVTVTTKGTPGRVSVTGPRSCLPPSNVAAGWKHSAASGWSFTGGALKLDGKSAPGTIDGATLGAGSSHTLVGTATFVRNGVHKTLKATLSFKACANG